MSMSGNGLLISPRYLAFFADLVVACVEFYSVGSLKAMKYYRYTVLCCPIEKGEDVHDSDIFFV